MRRFAAAGAQILGKGRHKSIPESPSVARARDGIVGVFVLGLLIRAPPFER
jgi:hypothetical protein